MKEIGRREPLADTLAKRSHIKARSSAGRPFLAKVADVVAPYSITKLWRQGRAYLLEPHLDRGWLRPLLFEVSISRLVD
jgi:hypothetical protein